MGQGVLAQVGHGTAGLLDDVVGGAGAGGNALVGSVGDAEQDVADFVLGAVALVGVGLLLRLEYGHGLLDLLGLVLFAFLHQLADFGGVFLELVGGFVVLALAFLADDVEGHDVGNGLARVKAFDGETVYNPLCVFFDFLKCEHRICLVGF